MAETLPGDRVDGLLVADDLGKTTARSRDARPERRLVRDSNGGVRQRRRPVGLGQVDPAQPHRPAGHAHRRAASVLLGADTGAAGKKGAVAAQRGRSASSSSSTTCCPSSACSRTCIMPAAIAGRRGPRSRTARDGDPRAVWASTAWRKERQRPLGRPEAARGHRPGAHEPSRCSCSPTSRPATWTAEQHQSRLQPVPRDQCVESVTAFMIVTHERAVAQQTDRILEVRDGRCVQDVRNEYLRRLAAAAERRGAPGAADPAPRRPYDACPPSWYPLRHRVIGARRRLWARRPVVGVAQLVELQVVAPAVAGSNPVLHPNHAMNRPARSAGRPR